MRILSQDGMIFNDIPYEKFVLGIARDRGTDKFCIVVQKEYIVSESGFPLNGIMAEYSTESKARKAMEMLHEAYCGKLHNTIDEFVFRAKNYDSKPELLKFLNEAMESVRYFRFPADDEVEVSEC